MIRKTCLVFLPFILTMWLAATANAEPRLPMSVTSINWSGYAVERRKPEPKFRSVQASWVVPKVDCTIPLEFGAAYSANWVGLDGFASDTVEQIGTSANCMGTIEIYSVWFEMYPEWPADIAMDVSSGDRIEAEVVWKGGTKFYLYIRNETTDESFHIVQRSKNASRHSAEAVVEAPSSPLFGVLPLSPFGVTGFDNVTVDGRDPGNLPTLTKIDMTDKNDRRIMRTSVSDFVNKSFTVTWFRS